MDRLCLAVVLVVVAIGVAASPSTALPIGTVVAFGDSMGDDGPQFLIYADLEPGVDDVVIFEGRDEWVSHRVIDHKDGRYQTMGDANPVPDQGTVDDVTYYHQPWATSENIAGVEIARAPLWNAAAVVLSLPILLSLTRRLRRFKQTL